jgi:TPR repeat protein
MKLCVFWLVTAIAGCAAMGQGNVVERPAAATKYFEVTTAHFGVWIDPKEWKRNPHPLDLFSLDFLYLNGKAYALLAAGPNTIPFDSLAAYALRGLRAGMTEIEIVAQESRVLSGKEVLFLTFSGMSMNDPVTIYGYYYSGPEGTVQLSVVMRAAFAEKYKPAAEAFLNGLQIGTPNEEPAIAGSTPAIAGSTPAEAGGSPTPAEIPEPDIAVLNASVPYGVIDAATMARREILAGHEAEGVSTLEALAKKGDPKAQAFLALCYDGGKGVVQDPAEALKLMMQAASKYPDAKTILGEWYANGHILPKDLQMAEKLFGEAAAAGSPGAETGLGQLLLATEPAAAAGWFRKAADQGFAKGEYSLAACYGNGVGVPKDPAEQMKWLERASTHGYPEAQFIMAQCYWLGRGVPQNAVAAAGLFRSLALSGTAAAENNYAACLWTGSGVPMDRDESLVWRQKAADQGEVDAESFLGRMYCTGDGVPRDIQQGLGWYQKAADQGLPAAECMVGFAYLHGEGVEKDLGKAVEWLEKAAQQGNVRAEGVLGGLYLGGFKEVPANPQESLKWAQDAANFGDPNGVLTMGQIYEHGIGVAADPGKAYYWFQKAASKGIATGEFGAALHLLRGAGVPKDFAAGLALLRKAADQDDGNAEFQLGLFYMNGEGVPKDPVEAVKWFGFSAAQGNPRGENSLGYALAIGAGVKEDLVEACKWFVLASSQDTDPDPKNRAMVNMRTFFPKMTLDQIEEGRKRAGQFVPKHTQPIDADPFSMGVS